jgi:biopolymer transport protein ExbD
MRLKRRNHHAPVTEVNLIPMMDVLLTVLTFFIIISMTLSTGQNVLGVKLPKTEDGSTQTSSDAKTPDPLTVGINQKGDVVIEGKPIEPSQLQARLQAYFQKSSQGFVVIQADRTLAYEKITKVLGQVRAVGGDRVALAIDK